MLKSEELPVGATDRCRSIAAFGLAVVKVNHFLEQTPFDLHQATRVAAARLNEQWVSPDTMAHSLVAGTGEGLGALLCAYGKIAEEVDRLEKQAIHWRTEP